jgi:hypothetical protein
MNEDRVAGEALSCHSDAAPNRTVDYSASRGSRNWSEACRNLPSRINSQREHSYRDRGRH